MRKTFTKNGRYICDCPYDKDGDCEFPWRREATNAACYEDITEAEWADE